jgi:hypothetical protein
MPLEKAAGARSSIFVPSGKTGPYFWSSRARSSRETRSWPRRSAAERRRAAQPDRELPGCRLRREFRDSGCQRAVESELQRDPDRDRVETINWNDGQSMSFAFTATAAHVGSNTDLTETGDVVSGEFSGDHAVEKFTAPNLAFADCSTATGVTSLDYATVLTISPL